MGNSTLREGTSYIKAVNSFLRALFSKEEVALELGMGCHPPAIAVAKDSRMAAKLGEGSPWTADKIASLEQDV